MALGSPARIYSFVNLVIGDEWSIRVYVSPGHIAGVLVLKENLTVPDTQAFYRAESQACDPWEPLSFTIPAAITGTLEALRAYGYVVTSDRWAVQKGLIIPQPAGAVV